MKECEITRKGKGYVYGDYLVRDIHVLDKNGDLKYISGSELVLTKDEFVKCYNAWIKEPKDEHITLSSDDTM